MEETDKDMRMETILSICGGILMFMFFFIAVYTFIMDYLIRYEYEIVRIGVSPPKKGKKINPENQQQSQLEIV